MNDADQASATADDLSSDSGAIDPLTLVKLEVDSYIQDADIDEHNFNHEQHVEYSNVERSGLFEQYENEDYNELDGEVFDNPADYAKNQTSSRQQRSNPPKLSTGVNQCQLCRKIFKTSWNLREHMRVHTGDRERPFKCPTCSKAFIKSSHLKAHIRLHTGEKPFQCTECEKSFAEKSNLTAHMKRKH